MRVAITGASGLIGSALARALERAGNAVVRIGRHSSADVVWDVGSGQLPARALEGIDAAVCLAGAPIARRWTTARRREIRDSRVHGTELFARTLAGLSRRPSVLLSGSAIGIYGNRGDEVLTESSAPGAGFLATVVQHWEAAASPAAEAGIRVVHLRTGIALAEHGGALAKLLPFFRLGVAGRLGGGRQWMSWIGLGDLVRALRFLLDADVHGAVNLVAPHPVTNAEFTQTLADVLSRPAVLPVPAFAMELLYGQMARETILASQRVEPGRLQTAGFAFDEPHLEGALRRALDRERK